MQKFNLFKKNKNYILIFLLFFVTRFLFYLFSPYDNFELQPDSYWYSDQSDNILKKEFNLLRPLFITAPFFSYFQALNKLIFFDYWKISLSLTQIIISSLSGVYFYRLSRLFFEKRISIFGSFLFCFYPLTLWYTFTFTQDIWFQSFLVIFCFYFNDYLINDKIKSFYLSIILFSITYLTKSHILLFAPFILIILLLKKNINLKKRISLIIIFGILSFIFSIPYGLYNLKVNGMYVISSSGLGGTFLVGHNEEAYLNHLNKEELNQEQIQRFRNADYKILRQVRNNNPNAKPKEIQSLYFNEGIKWVFNNKLKSLELLSYHLKSFITPGINKFWYNYNIWLIVLIITSPIYFSAYISLYLELKGNFYNHFWMLGLIFSILFFSLFFYYSGRFRVITLDPFYIMYSSKLLFNTILKKIF